MVLDTITILHLETGAAIAINRSRRDVCAPALDCFAVIRLETADGGLLRRIRSGHVALCNQRLKLSGDEPVFRRRIREIDRTAGPFPPVGGKW